MNNEISVIIRARAIKFIIYVCYYYTHNKFILEFEHALLFARKKEKTIY